MNFKKILFVAIFVSLFFDATFFSIPIVFPLCILCYILYPDVETVIISLAAGIVLDSLRLTPIGITALALAISFSILEVIKKALTFKDYKLIIITLFIGTYIFATIFSYNDNLLPYIVVYVMGGLVVYYLSRKKLLWQK